MKKSLLILLSCLLLISCLAFSAMAETFAPSLISAVYDNKISFDIQFGAIADSEYVSLALYDDDGRLVKFLEVSDIAGKTSANVVTDEVETAETAKLFIMKDKTSFMPLCNAVSVSLNRKNERIVVSSQVEYVNSKYVYSYEIINPYTGATESTHGTTTYASSSDMKAVYTSGDVVTLTSDSKVYENSTVTFGNLATFSACAPSQNNFGLFWVVGYDAENSTIDVVRYDTAAASTGWDTAATETDIQYAQFDESEIYKINIKDAAVSILKNTGTFKYYASMTIGNADGLNGEDYNYLAYNDNYIALAERSDADADYNTIYGRFPKVYLNIGTADNVTDCYGKADYIVVIVNNNENEKYCDVKDI